MNVLAKAAVQGAACGLMIGVVLLVGGNVWRPAAVAAQTDAVPAVVRARRFEMLSVEGRTLATVGLIPGGYPALTLSDMAGKMRAELTVLPDGTPGLYLKDAAGKTRVSLVGDIDGGPFLDLFDPAGKQRMELHLFSGGIEALSMVDTTGQVRQQLTLGIGGPFLSLFDATGKERATLGTTTLKAVKTREERKRAESSLVLFDKDEKVLWAAP